MPTDRSFARLCNIFLISMITASATRWFANFLETFVHCLFKSSAPTSLRNVFGLLSIPPANCSLKSCWIAPAWRSCSGIRLATIVFRFVPFIALQKAKNWFKLTRLLWTMPSPTNECWFVASSLCLDPYADSLIARWRDTSYLASDSQHALRKAYSEQIATRTNGNQ